MKFFTCAFLTLSLLGTLLKAEEEKAPINKNHILYLTKSGKVQTAVDQYIEYKNQLGKHDPEILEQMSLIILDNGMGSKDVEKQIISLYGASLANVNSLLDLCEMGMKTHNPNTQLVSIQMAGQLQDDRSIDLLKAAFNSKYLGIRMEAAMFLAQRKDKSAVGYIESLMHKLPPFFKCFFSDMYALVGTKEAMHILKKMINDHEPYNRIAATLAAAKFGRDDLLKDIRMAATHKNPAEQEACSFALGILKDSHSLEQLEEIAKSTDPHTKLAAIHSLVLLGKEEKLKEIQAMAEEKDLFAINLLGYHKGSEDTLAKLVSDKDRQVRFNAAIALLKRRDPRAVGAVLEVLMSRRLDLGFAPSHSQGKSMMYWKIIPSASAHAKKSEDNGILGVSQALREQVLLDCLELEQRHFVKIAKQLFTYEQRDLIPMLIHLLCNLNTDEVTTLLKEKAEEIGSPFIRQYATLALCKLKTMGPYEERLADWIQKQKETEIFRFKPLIAKSSSETSFNFQLSPVESSALLIESLMMIVDRHDERGINLLLEVLKNTHANNRPVVAGLLMKTLE